MDAYLSSGFRDAEIGERQSQQAECSEEDICAPSDGCEHIRGNQPDNAGTES